VVNDGTLTCTPKRDDLQYVAKLTLKDKTHFTAELKKKIGLSDGPHIDWAITLKDTRKLIFSLHASAIITAGQLYFST
jgi:hypothetical protein